MSEKRIPNWTDAIEQGEFLWCWKANLLRTEQRRASQEVTAKVLKAVCAGAQLAKSSEPHHNDIHDCLGLFIRTASEIRCIYDNIPIAKETPVNTMTPSIDIDTVNDRIRDIAEGIKCECDRLIANAYETERDMCKWSSAIFSQAIDNLKTVPSSAGHSLTDDLEHLKEHLPPNGHRYSTQELIGFKQQLLEQAIRKGRDQLSQAIPWEWKGPDSLLGTPFQSCGQAMPEITAFSKVYELSPLIEQLERADKAYADLDTVPKRVLKTQPDEVDPYKQAFALYQLAEALALQKDASQGEFYVIPREKVIERIEALSSPNPGSHRGRV